MSQQANIQESSSADNQKQTNSLTVVLLHTLKLSKLNGHLTISLRNALANILSYPKILKHSLAGPSKFFKIRELMVLWVLTVTSALQMQTLILKAQALIALTWQCLRQITAEVSLNWR
ncbi:hypothetical protein FGO68_gene6071 [Halteria grandinella]|uniref:Uncharacterized protein n=1 Tax=Halteria grandinella TaxID=5974 RepID=A0A8J8T6Q0_HALGN|nr:hypothetical protein FGO68_gene6071 [Halteria grandinella]